MPTAFNKAGNISLYKAVIPNKERNLPIRVISLTIIITSSNLFTIKKPATLFLKNHFPPKPFTMANTNFYHRFLICSLNRIIAFLHQKGKAKNVMEQRNESRYHK